MELSPRHRRGIRGWSMTEVLVLLAVLAVALFLLIFIPALSAVKGYANQTKCLNNLKQVDFGTISFAIDNRDHLPSVPAGNNRWAWDIDWKFAEILTNNGCPREVMYDPAVPRQDDDALWNREPGVCRTIGYALALGGTFSTVKSSDQVLSLTDKDPSTGKVRDVSRRILVADALLTPSGQNDPAKWKSYNWTKITNSARIFSSTLHKRSVNSPIGETVGMLDGHVAWFPWSNQLPRTTGANNSAIFWW